MNRLATLLLALSLLGCGADDANDVQPVEDAGPDTPEPLDQGAKPVDTPPIAEVTESPDTPTGDLDASDLSDAPDVPDVPATPSDPGAPPPDTGPVFQLPEAAGVYPFDGCSTGDPEARFLGESGPPPTLTPGGIATVFVVFANCGDTPWTAAPAVGPNGHKLGSQAPQDNTHWGVHRVPLPGDVGPGQLVRVDFDIKAPDLPGYYGFRWRIVNEGVAWLDESSPEHTVAVATSSTPATLQELFAGKAHFVVDQDPVPVNGPSSGHREAYAVNRTDVGPATVYLYHRCFGQSAADASICLSISEDGGTSFAAFLGEIIGPDPGHIFSVAPTVIQKGSTWTMVYEESHVAALYWAQSSDGIDWVKKGQLLSKKSGEWDGGANATPGAFVDADGTIYVFYAGFPVGGAHMSIGYASGKSMKTLKKYGGNPVFSPPATGWDKGQLSMARVVEQGGVYYMIHEGAALDFTCEGANKYGWGMAKSADLKTWSPLPSNPLGLAGSGCGNDMPSLFIRFDGEVFAYHTSKDTKRIVREHLVAK